MSEDLLHHFELEAGGEGWTERLTGLERVEGERRQHSRKRLRWVLNESKRCFFFLFFHALEWTQCRS